MNGFDTEKEETVGFIARLLGKVKPKNSQVTSFEDPMAVLQMVSDVAGKHGEKAGQMAFLLAALAHQGELQKSGCDTDEIPWGKGEYGLELTNPVPVCGVRANDRYLGYLRTADGESIKWDRIGSFYAANIENPIDGYRITTGSGRDLGMIYISPYHKRTSQRAPRGFRVVD